MGGGIAAHLANAGIRVLLLDVIPPDLTKLMKAKPAAFFHPSFARLVTTGLVDDNLAKLAECDLVVEAIIEKLEPKRALFEKLERALGAEGAGTPGWRAEGAGTPGWRAEGAGTPGGHAEGAGTPGRRPACIVTSNTSGLRITDMMFGRSESFRRRFLVTHFFNPVRYMKLLEIVAGPDTDPAVVDRVRRFGEDVLGKGIVLAKDTPNFIGNRIGMHAVMATIHQMLADGLAPEDVDAITGQPMAHPRSASFRTADVVGLDTLVHVADNCYAALASDEEREVFRAPPYIRTMIERRLLGDKTKAGFSRKGKDGALETFDPRTLDYRARGGDETVKKTTKAIAKIEDPRERVRALVADTGKAGQFAWKVLARSLAYAARRVPEIADRVDAIDDAVKWGYAWELGPFETWDALGFVETADRMTKEGIALPDSIAKMKASGAKSFYAADGRVFDLVKGQYAKREIDPRTATLTILRKGSAPVLKNDGAEAWDLGDGVLGLTFKTKANSIDPDVIKMIGDATSKAETDFRAMVVANEGDFFCVGANLLLVVMAASQKEWEQIRTLVKGYQSATQRMKYASVPVVAAPFGMTLGGGLELCFGGAAVQAAAETYAGLVEVGVGLVPGGAGTMNMLWRAFEAQPEGASVNAYDLVTQVFKNIALAKVATSADEAKALGYFRKGDGVSFDRARLLGHAKARAIGLAEAGHHPPAPQAYVLPGESGMATLSMMIDTLVAGGYASEHDAKIARKLAQVLCGGIAGASHEVTEEEMLELEREAFVSLCGEPKSQERMQYMLMNNRPLRN
jgi:3-hydroxyacyl-CoA dehydrogenase